jgi:hypothetical protein
MSGSSLRMSLHFGTVEGLASSNDPESHAGGSVATGGDFHVARVKVYDLDKRDNVAVQFGGWA